MIETIKMVFDLPHNLFKVTLTGKETYLIDITYDYLNYSIKKSTQVFNTKLNTGIFDKIWFNGNYYVDGIQNNESFTAWAKVLLVENLEAKVRLGVIEMTEALRIIKLEYPELVWSEYDQKKILHRKKMMRDLWNGYGLW